MGDSIRTISEEQFTRNLDAWWRDVLRPYVDAEVHRAVQEIPFTVREEVRRAFDETLRARLTTYVAENIDIHLSIRPPPEPQREG